MALTKINTKSPAVSSEKKPCSNKGDTIFCRFLAMKGDSMVVAMIGKKEKGTSSLSET